MTSFHSSHKGHSPFLSCSALWRPSWESDFSHCRCDPPSDNCNSCESSNLDTAGQNVGPRRVPSHASQDGHLLSPEGPVPAVRQHPSAWQGVSDTCLPCGSEAWSSYAPPETLKEVLIYPVPLKIEL